MQYFEKELIRAINEDKITCFCDDSYARLLYWGKALNIKEKLKFDKELLPNLPDYYYLGFPIKELIQERNSLGYCHSCALALSLCHNNFSIITCNLSSYASYLNFIGSSNDLTFEHTILLIDNGNKVIDTSFGFITDLDTYKHIFKPNRIKNISSNDINNTSPYLFLEQEKGIVGPSIDSELFLDDDYKDYLKKIKYFLSLCSEYKNNNSDLEYYYNDCISINSSLGTINYWRNNISIDYFPDLKVKIKK